MALMQSYADEVLALRRAQAPELPKTPNTTKALPKTPIAADSPTEW